MNLHDQIIGSQESSVFLLIICVEETDQWMDTKQGEKHVWK